MDQDLVRAVKKHLSGQSSDGLRAMLAKRDAEEYSAEAFAAAQQVLDERESGVAAEPKIDPPPPEPTPAEAEEYTLRRQVRGIGLYFYFRAGLLLLAAVPLIALRVSGDPEVVRGIEVYPVVAVVLAVALVVVGRGLRRFSPFARGAGMVVSAFSLLGCPVGTVIGLYCFFKLAKADHLFGGTPHPAAEEPSADAGEDEP